MTKSGKPRNLLSLALVAAGLMLPCLAVSGPVAGYLHYTDHDFDAAIAACKGGPDVASRLVLALSYTERYRQEGDKRDKRQAALHLGLLGVEVVIQNAATIEKFRNVEGNPAGSREADKLLKLAFSNSRRKPGQVPAMAPFADPARGVDVSRMALEAIRARLRPVRAYVMDGGAIPEELRNGVFANDSVIASLTVALSHKKTARLARECLVLIESPALAHLEKQELAKEATDTILDIKKAIAVRRKKHPDSTWYSAYRRL